MVQHNNNGCHISHNDNKPNDNKMQEELDLFAELIGQETANQILGLIEQINGIEELISINLKSAITPVKPPKINPSIANKMAVATKKQITHLNGKKELIITFQPIVRNN